LTKALDKLVAPDRLFGDLPDGQINAVAKSGKSRLDCQRMLHPRVDVVAKISS
jgi:hypothetical protein